jgi:hypothetical protein
MFHRRIDIAMFSALFAFILHAASPVAETMSTSWSGSADIS